MTTALWVLWVITWCPTTSTMPARLTTLLMFASDMLAKGQRRRPVVGDNNKLIGQITCRQILAAVRKLARTRSSGS